MKVMRKFFMLFCMISALNGAEVDPSELTIEWLRKMPKATLQSADIINLLSGSSVSSNGRGWALFGTSFVGNIGRIIEATEIPTSDARDFSWLFYVTIKDGQQILVLHKIFQSFMGDDDLLIFTPVSDDFVANPWVRATTISSSEDKGEEPPPHLIELFEFFLNRK